MDISRDYFKDEIMITFYKGENPEKIIPKDWKIINRVEPSTYKGFENAGIIICKPIKKLALDK